MAGLFGSITIKGNRLTEFASQTATVGVPIPYGYGRFPCEGNVIFAPMPPKEHVKKKKQGKGGVKTEEYSYTLSYAVAFCEGPIFGFLTIKRNGKVVWTQDPNASVDDRAYAAKWKQKATFYFGTEEQLPDSTIESYRGVGQVSAFRGIAYIVVEDDDVTDGGGAVPTYEAVIIASPPDVYVTSKPYDQFDRSEASAWSSAQLVFLRTIAHTVEISDEVTAAYQGGYVYLKDRSNRTLMLDQYAATIEAPLVRVVKVAANAQSNDSATNFMAVPSINVKQVNIATTAQATQIPAVIQFTGLKLT